MTATASLRLSGNPVARERVSKASIVCQCLTDGSVVVVSLGTSAAHQLIQSAYALHFAVNEHDTQHRAARANCANSPGADVFIDAGCGVLSRSAQIARF